MKKIRAELAMSLNDKMIGPTTLTVRCSWNRRIHTETEIKTMLQTAQFFSEEETEGGMDLEERRSDGGGGNRSGGRGNFGGDVLHERSIYFQ